VAAGRRPVGSVKKTAPCSSSIPSASTIGSTGERSRRAASTGMRPSASSRSVRGSDSASRLTTAIMGPP
jgi:hypothetical protein